ncbi:hypothetical protein, partial [Nocardiopsis protaetiae]|uniref:hypothetical protein n=1 Tax=Nocardiopsis protaetiae TaxID=3382270 RepID=UPI00387AEB9E
MADPFRTAEVDALQGMPPPPAGGAAGLPVRCAVRRSPARGLAPATTTAGLHPAVVARRPGHPGPAPPGRVDGVSRG